MTTHVFRCEQWLPRPCEAVFAFFSNAANLETITPRWLRFEILTPQPVAIRVGTLIDYRLRIHGWPVRWRTEITAWDPPHRFVDEQRRGPYRLWVHEHRFRAERGGTNCQDQVHYAVPGGALINRLLVRRDVERIFTHRREQLERIFAASRPNEGEDSSLK